MKKAVLISVLVVTWVMAGSFQTFAQWQGAGKDHTPGDSWAPLCLLEKDGYIFFGDIHVGIFRIQQPITETSEWEHFAIPGINVVYDLVVFDNKLWCTSDGNGVFSSDDNGATWMDKNAGLTHHKVYALTVSENTLFCGTYHGGVFRYNNATGMWAAVNNGFPYDPSRWYVIELQTIDNAVFVSTMGIGIFMSTDLGQNWNSINHMQYNGGAEVKDFVKHGGYLMIPAYSQGVLRSMNSGQTWDFCNEGMPYQSYAKTLAANETAVFVGTSGGGGVLMSKDHGDHWKNINLGFPWSYQMNRYEDVKSLAVIGDYLYAGVWWNGVIRAKLTDLYTGLLTIPELNYKQSLPVVRKGQE